jgi:SAM-dependent methyltransferase
MAATVADARSVYDAFAPYYDAFTAGSDYEAWTRELLGVAERHGIRSGAVLDLACGTGKSFMGLLERGFRVTGCDSSSAMLAEAACRAPATTLVQADLRSLPELGRFDLVTCIDDSLNYLPDDAALAAAFAGIERNLDSHGVVLFDLNSLLAYRTTFASHTLSERDGIVFAWQGSSTSEAAPGSRAEATIDAFAPEPGGLYRRVTTCHVQRHFPRARVVELLARAGLECLGVYGVRGDCSLVEPAVETDHLKLLYTARRAKGGDAG